MSSMNASKLKSTCFFPFEDFCSFCPLTLVTYKKIYSIIYNTNFIINNYESITLKLVLLAISGLKTTPITLPPYVS